MAIKAINIAPTFKASDNPSAAPRAAASMTFAGFLSPSLSSSSCLLCTSGLSVSGNNNFAITSPAGAAITLAANKNLSGTPSAAYPKSVEPDTDANPPTITANSSDFVRRGMYGRITSGASVCPKKIFAVADNDSD